MAKRHGIGKPNKSSPRRIWHKFLLMLNSTWGRITVIFVIFSAGFTVGRYYEEVRVEHAHLEYDQQREDYWRGVVNQWYKERNEYINQIYSLREQNLQLLSNSGDTVRIIKLSTYESK